MFKVCWVSRSLRSWDKKKLTQYKLSDKIVGYGQKLALIRFYLHKDVHNLDEFAQYWCEIEYLAKIGVLTMAQIPLKLS